MNMADLPSPGILPRVRALRKGPFPQAWTGPAASRIVGRMDPVLQRLQNLLRDRGGVAIAFSGGRDSGLLLAAAVSCLPRRRVAAFLGVSPLLPERERHAAHAAAAALGLPLTEIPMDPLGNPEVAANGPDRCYHCKRALLLRLLEETRRLELPLADGSHRDDDPAARPGSRALRELGVWSPLREAGLGRREITRLSRLLDLPAADRPSQSCLATRIPPGVPLALPLLARIEAAEELLAAEGFAGIRARHHGDLLRLEVLPADLPRLAAPRRRRALAALLHELGWRHVTLDLDGYRCGSHAAPDREDA